MSNRPPVRPGRDLLRATLFRLGGNRDGQLLLALHVALSELQRRCPAGESVVGIGSVELWDYLREHSDLGAVHPNIDQTWSSPRELQMSLSRLRQQGLARGGRIEYGGPSLWRPTDAAGAYLREHLLFGLNDAA
jgi:hypothetical protein